MISPKNASSLAAAFKGRWRIKAMDLWARDAIDLVEPGFLAFNGEEGEMRFIAVRAWLDVRYDIRDKVPIAEFSWEGVDEGDQRSGQGVDALMVASDPYLFSHRNRLIALATQYSVPTIYTVRAYVVAGGLISYTSNPDMEYERAVYVGRILNGEKAGNLPVQQPTKFDLAINLKTAKELALTVPLSLLARADEVIE